MKHKNVYLSGPDRPMEELNDLRTTNMKVFMNDLGNKCACIYPKPVHFLEDGTYMDIDDRFGDEDTAGQIGNRKGRMKAKLANKSKQQGMVSITKDKFKWSWGPVGAGKAGRKIVHPDDSGESSHGAMDLKNLVSDRAVYENVWPDTDLSYQIISEDVKEDIVLKKAPDTTPAFTFAYKVQGSEKLTASAADPGSIDFKDDQGKAVFKICTPFMTDTKGAFSEDVRLDLSVEKAGKEYLVSVMPDMAWLSDPERVYPVTIDPVITTSTDITDIRDAFVSSKYKTANYQNEQLLKTGYANGETFRSYLKFELPSLETEDTVVNAIFRVGNYSTGSVTRRVNVHRVKADWDSATVTWNNKPAFDPYTEDFLSFKPTDQDNRVFDITSLVQDWYNGADNHGIMMKDNEETGAYTAYFSSDFSIQGNRPFIQIFYISSRGIEDHFSYHTQAAGRAGTGYVNDYNGNQVFVHDTLSLTGSRMPVTVKHVYNACSRNHNIGYGAGWRLSCHQEITRVTIGDTVYYRYRDEDGTFHYYKQTDGKWKDELVPDLELVLDTSDANNYYTIRDKQGGKLVFDSSGLLAKMVDANGNYMQVIYENQKVKKVRDGGHMKADGTDDSTPFREAAFTYNSAGLLDKVTDPDGKVTSFIYTNGRLTGIKDPEGKIGSFTYDTAADRGMMTSACDPFGYKVTYTWTGKKPYRVTGIAEAAGSAPGASVTIAYGRDMTTFTDHEDHVQQLRFDRMGRTVCVRDGEGYGQMYEHGSSGGSVNKLTGISSLTRIANQRLREVVPESTPAVWTKSDPSKCTVDPDASFITGLKSLKMAPSAQSDHLMWSQNVSVSRGRTYTFSAYVRQDITSQASAKEVYLKVTAGSEQKAYVNADDSADWQRLAGTFTLPEGEGNVTVKCILGVRGMTGSVWASGMQLDETAAAGRVNLAANNAFTQGLQCYTKLNATSTDGVYAAGSTIRSTKMLKGILTADGVRVRTGAGTEFAVLGFADKDTVMEIYGADYDKEGVRWFFGRVPYEDTDYTGYISSAYVAEAPPSYGITIKAVAAKNNFTLRSTPGGSDVVITVPSRGHQMTIHGGGKSGSAKWYKVKLTYNGISYTGWANAEHLAVYAPAVSHGEVNTAAAEVRHGPGTNYNLKATLTTGTEVDVLGRTVLSSGVIWDYIRYAAGTSIATGYMQAGFVTVTSTEAMPQLVTIYSEKVPREHALSEHVYLMNGSRTKEKRLTQKISIAGSAGDVYTGAGWGYGRSIPLSEGRHFGIFVNFVAAGGAADMHYADFGADGAGWQFVSSAFVAKHDYVRVETGFAYAYGANTAYFDGLALYKERFGQTYTYDSEGKVVSAKDKADKETKLTYNGSSDLAKVTDPKGRNLKYTYDDRHNVTKAESAAGMVCDFSYDAYGNTLTLKTSDKNDSSKKILASAAYTSDNDRIRGQYMKSLTDPFGKVKSFTRHVPTGRVSRMTDPAGHQTDYTYEDELGKLIMAQQGSISTAYTYTADRLTKLTHNGTEYSFTYDGFGKCTQAKAGGRTLVTQTYGENNGDLLSASYGNGWEAHYSYDGLHRVTGVTAKKGSEETLLCEYTYNDQGAVARITDHLNPSKSVTFDYDLTGRVGAARYDDGTGYKYSYDDTDCLVREYQVLPDTARTVTRTYDADDRETRSQTTGITVQKAYDGLGRLSTQTYGSHQVSYEYAAGAGGSTSNRIKKVTGAGRTWEYTYDDLGNVLTEKTGGKTRRFTYDAYSRLTRVDDQAANVTTAYAYDNGGNMTARKTYAYTTGTLPATPVTNLAYTYDSSWKDLLTKIGTASVTSDASGNILTDGTYTCTWTRGSLLASMTKSGQTAQYTYDIKGIRTRKVCGGVTTDYTYAGSLLLAEKRGTAWQRYFYDAGGILAAITYGGATYYYVRDGLMNITDLIDSNGNSVVHYTYDTWGKILTVTGSMASTLGHDNPFRYKGYYYDEESGLYYLISRYYDPETGRFISMDALQVLTMTPMDLVNKNLYVYCDGNPVIRIDERGSLWWVAPLVGAGIGVAAQYVEDVIRNVHEGKTGSDIFTDVSDIRKYIGSAVGGAIAAIPGANVGDVIIVGGLGNVVSDYIKGDIHNEDEAQMSFVKGGAANAVGYAVEHASALLKVKKVDKMSRPARKQYLNKKIYHSKHGAVNTNYHAYNALKSSAKANLLKQNLVSYHMGIRASAISAIVLLPK